MGVVFACAACAGPPVAFHPWTDATDAIGRGLEQGFHELGSRVRLAGPVRAAAGLEAVTTLAAGFTRCRDGWRGLAAYARRARAECERFPYEADGIEEQVAALAALHRELLMSGAIANDPLGDEQARLIAEEMRAAHDTVGAFARAQAPLVLLAEEIALTHQEHAASIAAEAARLARIDDAGAGSAQAEADALAADLAEIEDELRMQAAGAGRARAGAEEIAEDRRARLAAALARVELAVTQRASFLAAFERYRERVERTAHAARAWAIAQREAARAAREGLKEPNFSLLLASAETLAAP